MRGGALQRIGRLTPEITRSSQLKEMCEFSYLSAHGQSSMESLMIVPKNTFILFMGRSGFSTFIGDTNERLFINSNEDKYINDMYNVFFKESSTNDDRKLDASMRPYSDAYVYTPGDLIHDMLIDFNSMPHEGFFRLGYYTLPLPEPRDFIPSAETLMIPFLVEYSKQYNEDPEANPIKIAKDKKEAWNLLATLDHAEMIKYYEDHFYNKFNIKDWFENDDVLNNIMNYVITPYCMRTDDINNKIQLDTMEYENSPGEIRLSALLRNYPSEKNYRFIIITACRPPDIDPEPSPEFSYENRLKVSEPDPQRLPPGTSVGRKFLRRASFSAKGPDVVCPLGAGLRPMNLMPLKDLFNSMGDVHFPKTESDFINSLVVTRVLIKNRLNQYVFGTESIQSHVFFMFIDNLYKTYSLLTTTDPKEQGAKEFFTRFLFTARAIFQSYAQGLILDSNGLTTLANAYDNSPYPSNTRANIMRGYREAGILKGGRRTRKQRKRRRRQTRGRA